MSETTKSHIKSFILSFLTDLAYGGIVGELLLRMMDNNDFSKSALYSLGYAVFRTFVRVLAKELNITTTKSTVTESVTSKLPNTPPTITTSTTTIQDEQSTNS